MKTLNRILYSPEADAGGDDSSANGETPQESSMAEKLARLQSEVKSETSASSQLAKLVSDPDIRALLEAKQAGKKVKITDAEEAPKFQIPEDDKAPAEEVDWEELTRAQLVEHAEKRAMQKAVKILAPLIEKEIGSIKETLKPIQDSVTASQRTQVSSAIEDARKKFPDWDKYKEKMLTIHNQVGGTLGPVELYLLAKHQDGSLLRDTGTDSEKPDAFGVPELKKPSGKYRGHGGIERLLTEAIERHM